MDACQVQPSDGLAQVWQFGIHVSARTWLVLADQLKYRRIGYLELSNSYVLRKSSVMDRQAASLFYDSTSKRNHEFLVPTCNDTCTTDDSAAVRIQ